MQILMEQSDPTILSAEQLKETSNDLGKWISPSNMHIQVSSPFKRTAFYQSKTQSGRRGQPSSPFLSKNPSICLKIMPAKLNNPIDQGQTTQHIVTYMQDKKKGRHTSGPASQLTSRKDRSRLESRDGHSRLSVSTQKLSFIHNSLMSPLQNADLNRELAKTNIQTEAPGATKVVDRTLKKFSYNGLDLESYTPGKDENLEHQIQQCQKQIKLLQQEKFFCLTSQQAKTLQNYLNKRYRDQQVLKGKLIQFKPGSPTNEASLPQQSPTSSGFPAASGAPPSFLALPKKRSPRSIEPGDEEGSQTERLGQMMVGKVAGEEHLPEQQVNWPNYKYHSGQKVRYYQGCRSNSVQYHRKEANTVVGGATVGMQSPKNEQLEEPDVRRRVSMCEIATDMMEQAQTQPLAYKTSSTSTPHHQNQNPTIVVPAAPFSPPMQPTSLSSSLSPAARHNPTQPNSPPHILSSSSKPRVKAQKSQEFMPPQYELLTAPRGTKRTIRMSKTKKVGASSGHSSGRDGQEESDVKPTGEGVASESKEVKQYQGSMSGEMQVKQDNDSQNRESSNHDASFNGKVPGIYKHRSDAILKQQQKKSVAVATSQQKKESPSDKMTENTIVNESINIYRMMDIESLGNKKNGGVADIKDNPAGDHEVQTHYQSGKIMVLQNNHNYAGNLNFPKTKENTNVCNSPIVIRSPHITFKPSPVQSSMDRTQVEIPFNFSELQQYTQASEAGSTVLKLPDQLQATHGVNDIPSVPGTQRTSKEVGTTTNGPFPVRDLQSKDLVEVIGSSYRKNEHTKDQAVAHKNFRKTQQILKSQNHRGSAMAQMYSRTQKLKLISQQINAIDKSGVRQSALRGSMYSQKRSIVAKKIKDIIEHHPNCLSCMIPLTSARRGSCFNPTHAIRRTPDKKYNSFYGKSSQNVQGSQCSISPMDPGYDSLLFDLPTTLNRGSPSPLQDPTVSLFIHHQHHSSQSPLLSPAQHFHQQPQQPSPPRPTLTPIPAATGTGTTSTPLNCRRYFGSGAPRQSLAIGEPSVTKAPQMSEPMQILAAKREKRRRRYNNSVAAMAKLPRNEEQPTKLKLPELENIIRKDKIALSICEQFMPSNRDGDAQNESRNNTLRSKSIVQQWASTNTQKRLQKKPVSILTPKLEHPDKNALTFESQRLMSILQKGKMKLEKFQSQKRKKQKFRIESHELNQIEKKSLGVQSSVFKIPELANPKSQIAGSTKMQSSHDHNQSFGMAQTPPDNQFPRLSYPSTTLKNWREPIKFDQGCSPKHSDKSHSINEFVNKHLDEDHQGAENNINLQFNQKTVENSIEASRGLKTIDQQAVWPNPIGSPSNDAGATNTEEDSANVLDKIINTMNQQNRHIDAKNLAKAQQPALIEIKSQQQTGPTSELNQTKHSEITALGITADNLGMKQQQQQPLQTYRNLEEWSQILKNFAKQNQFEQSRAILSRTNRNSFQGAGDGRTTLYDLNESLLLQQPYTRRSLMDSSISGINESEMHQKERDHLIEQYVNQNLNALHDVPRDQNSQEFHQQMGTDLQGPPAPSQAYTKKPLITRIDLSKLIKQDQYHLLSPSQLNYAPLDADHLNERFSAFRTSHIYNRDSIQSSQEHSLGSIINKGQQVVVSLNPSKQEINTCTEKREESVAQPSEMNEPTLMNNNNSKMNSQQVLTERWNEHRTGRSYDLQNIIQLNEISQKVIMPQPRVKNNIEAKHMNDRQDNTVEMQTSQSQVEDGQNLRRAFETNTYSNLYSRKIIQFDAVSDHTEKRKRMSTELGSQTTSNNHTQMLGARFLSKARAASSAMSSIRRDQNVVGVQELDDDGIDVKNEINVQKQPNNNFDAQEVSGWNQQLLQGEFTPLTPPQLTPQLASQLAPKDQNSNFNDEVSNQERLKPQPAMHIGSHSIESSPKALAVQLLQPVRHHIIKAPQDGPYPYEGLHGSQPTRTESSLSCSSSTHISVMRPIPFSSRRQTQQLFVSQPSLIRRSVMDISKQFLSNEKQRDRFMKIPRENIRMGIQFLSNQTSLQSNRNEKVMSSKRGGCTSGRASPVNPSRQQSPRLGTTGGAAQRMNETKASLKEAAKSIGLWDRRTSGADFAHSVDIPTHYQKYSIAQKKQKEQNKQKLLLKELQRNEEVILELMR